MVSTNNAINKTVGATISGVTNTFTVTNGSNTASSAARETIVVGGGSAADPTLNFNVSGVTNWEMGIDNSVSDNLTISQGTALGTNDVWRMTTGGIRTMPLQPSFLAYKSANTANVTGDGTTYTIICDTVVFDQNANYNNGTGTFIAPVTGRYQFNVSIEISNVSASHTDCDFDLTTTNRQYRLSTTNPGAFGAVSFFSLSGSVLADMNAGNTAIIQVFLAGGPKTAGVNGNVIVVTSFSGFLVC